MGTREEDEFRRQEQGRVSRELEVHIERQRLRREAEQAAARRTRLHSFGLAGGRRSH